MKNLVVCLTFPCFMLFDNCSIHCFDKNFGGASDDVGFSSIQLYDGGFASLGWTKSYGNGQSDYYLIRTNSEGDTLWTKTYGQFNLESGLCIVESDGGGFILGGSGRSFGNGRSDCLVIRTDANGNHLWTKAYGTEGEDYLRKIAETPSGDLLICGYSDGNINGGKDMLMMKLDASGKLKWADAMGGIKDEEGWALTFDASGSAYFGGWTQTTNNGNADFYLVKKSVNGATLFEKTYGGHNSDSGLALLISEDSHLLFAGTTLSFGAGRGDMYLMKLDKEGQMIWQKTYGGYDDDYCSSICQTPQGYALTGFTNSFEASGKDIYVVTTDRNGNQLNQAVLHEEGNQEAWGIIAGESNSLIITGQGQKPGHSDYDLKLIKLNMGLTATQDESSDESQKEFTIYPNPANDYIYFGQFEKEAFVAIFDKSGKLMIHEIVNSLNGLNVTNLPSGEYIAQIWTEILMVTRKLIVSK
ncbi:MAG: T9SS type A sorting domain-containing protein [Saprospiraceae bacterium]|nr:T9SS type A sorting domain-containing protein [Saprospiraceae bacterium]